MSGDEAGLAPGMKVIGVNNETFSGERLVDALLDSIKRHRIELRLIEGEKLRTVAINYSEGIRYFVLVRDDSKPDILAQILSPLTVRPKTTSSPRETNRSRPPEPDVSTDRWFQLRIGAVAFGVIFVAFGLATRIRKKPPSQPVEDHG
jgi:hypothetical protein